MKKATFEAIKTALTNFGFADEDILAELDKEINKGAEAKAKNAEAYEALHDFIVGNLTDSPCTCGELWDVIKDWDETHEWEEDEEAPRYYQKAIAPLANAEKTGIRVTDAVYGVNEEKEGFNLVALFGGLNGPGKWPDYLKALTAIVEKLEARVVYMNVDAPDDVFYVILLVPEKEEN